MIRNNTEVIMNLDFTLYETLVKYQKKLNKKQIQRWLDKHEIKNYTINDDLTVDVNGDVFLFGCQLRIIPFKFGVINGFFDCSNNHIRDSNFFPIWVGDYFDCSDNKLIELNSRLTFVGKWFDCRWNNIKSIDNIEDKCNIGGVFYY